MTCDHMLSRDMPYHFKRMLQILEDGLPKLVRIRIGRIDKGETLHEFVKSRRKGPWVDERICAKTDRIKEMMRARREAKARG